MVFDITVEKNPRTTVISPFSNTIHYLSRSTDNYGDTLLPHGHLWIDIDAASTPRFHLVNAFKR